ncbi:MAG: hypothetical protein ACWA5R_05895 [bacterium]
MHDVKMITPKWHQIKVGPILRRENDLRWYRGLFNQTNVELNNSYLYIYKLVYSKANEPVSIIENPKNDKHLYVFTGCKDYFKQINNYRALIRGFLLDAVDEDHMQLYKECKVAPIAMHVRLGDFSPDMRTDFSWFIGVLTNIREWAGHNVPVSLFTDGSMSEIAELTALPNMSIINTNSAIADLLALSKAKIIIGSGGSTFSLWANFLGENTALFPKGYDPSWHSLKAVEGQFSITYDPSEFPPEGLQKLIKSLFRINK